MQQVVRRACAAERRLLAVPVSRIEIGQDRPRSATDQGAILALAESIRQCGLISPISVRESDGGYRLIAGERRLRAVVSLGLRFVDAFVVDACDMDAALMALVENIQREPLHYLEEAEAYGAILRDHGLTQRELAARIGRSQGAAANRMRLLGLTDERRQTQALKAAIDGRFSVRQLEDHVGRMEDRPRRTVKIVLRDHRVFVNTVLAVIGTLKKAGLNASGRVVDEQDRIEVIVTLPKILKA